MLLTRLDLLPSDADGSRPADWTSSERWMARRRTAETRGSRTAFPSLPASQLAARVAIRDGRLRDPWFADDARTRRGSGSEADGVAWERDLAGDALLRESDGGSTKREVKARTLPGMALSPNPAPVLVDDSLHDRQAYAGTLEAVA